MPFNSSSYYIEFEVIYRVKDVSYVDVFLWDHYQEYYDGYIYSGSVYYNDDNKQNNNVYEGNVQMTRSFSPPVHTPLFDPREGKGISIHHQVGSLGYYQWSNLGGNIGNVDSLTPPSVTLSEIYGIDINSYNVPIISVNSPKLYIGVRRTGHPKWFYIPAIYTLKKVDIYSDNFYKSNNGNKQYKTAVYVSGGNGLVDFDPMRIQGIPERRPSRENRFLQLHVSYMPDNVYYLFSSNDNTNQMFSFFNNYETGKLWIAHKSYGVY
jgi:hypothetical protein